ncbi:MAG: hypothetical protein JXR61_06200, partial [Prolixibacteraceae bacterium]|nr:hypothetical protein [Prolixibacteraceae bacterium]
FLKTKYGMNHRCFHFYNAVDFVQTKHFLNEICSKNTSKVTAYNIEIAFIWTRLPQRGAGCCA